MNHTNTTPIGYTELDPAAGSAADIPEVRLAVAGARGDKDHIGQQRSTAAEAYDDGVEAQQAGAA